MTAVEIAGRRAEISGAAEDGYFQNIGLHAASLHPLETFARTMLPTNAIVADIGANIGLTTILLSRLLPDGLVYAFEPSPVNVSYLRANLAANGARNVTVTAAVVSDAPGTAVFRHFDHFAAGSRTLAGVASGADINVPAIQLDAYAAKRGLRFDLLKIDTEGHEPWVLAGMAGLLRTDLPIWMEFNSHCLMASNANPAAFSNTLTTSFTVDRVEPDGTLARIDDAGRLLLENMQRGCVDDVVLRLRPGQSMPSLAAMTGNYQHAIAAQLAAVHSSTSWRVTAPLRAVGNAMKRLRG